jgi:hypothetical protein
MYVDRGLALARPRASPLNPNAVIHTWTGFAAVPAGRATFVILEGGSP